MVANASGHTIAMVMRSALAVAGSGGGRQRPNGYRAVRFGMQTARAGLPRRRAAATAHGCVVMAVASLEADTGWWAARPKRARSVQRLACTAGAGPVATDRPGRFCD